VESTPLICALGRWNRIGEYFVAPLLESGANPNIPGVHSYMQFFPLHLAVTRDAKEMVELLLKHNANPDNADYGGYTPLMEASGRGNTEIVEMLLKAGANPDLKTDMKGETALIMAIRNWHTDVVRLLLERGADPNAKIGVAVEKECALDIALELALSTIAGILMEHGAEPSRRFVKEFGQKVNLKNREEILDACDQRVFSPIFQDHEV
ncbi:MAG: ankyrin repeat domain-containing protein, partial [Candidatus Micrarchaeia archaeon]